MNENYRVLDIIYSISTVHSNQENFTAFCLRNFLFYKNDVIILMMKINDDKKLY